MQLSVVVPTLNGREELAGCLDALTEHAPDAELIVVNGPSADGTTGMVRNRDDVDVLVEIADRSVTVARNAGLDRASHDVIAFVNHGLSIEPGWVDAVRDGTTDHAAVTGPTHEHLTAGVTTDSKETRTIAGRAVTYFNPGNVAFHRSVLESLDGFDEYLQIGSSRDLAHRLARAGNSVGWDSSMCVSRDFEADGGIRERNWHWKYRSLSYRLVKNYGVRPTIVGRVLKHAGIDAVDALRGVMGGNTAPSKWFDSGQAVFDGITTGAKDGVTARYRAGEGNPNGRSARADRAVTIYDWR
jgi:glycosyltransferase involved in cell wall biosynthesis